MRENNAPWPPELVERLTALAGEGISAAKIAEKLGGRVAGFTRNTVVGKCARAGIKLLGTKSGRPNLSGNTYAKPRTNHRGDPMAPPVLRDVNANGPGRSMLDLEAGQCRWPIDLGPAESTAHSLFCGDPVEGGSYCPAHAQIASHPAAPSKPAIGTDRYAAVLRFSNGRYDRRKVA